jgi:hypothetical protein
VPNVPTPACALRRAAAAGSTAGIWPFFGSIRIEL